MFEDVVRGIVRGEHHGAQAGGLDGGDAATDVFKG
jgi:hypothetical protein